MREPIDMLRIAAGGISMSGNLYRFFDQFDFDNILSGHGCIRVSAGGGPGLYRSLPCGDVSPSYKKSPV